MAPYAARAVGIDRLDAFEAIEHPMFLARSRLQQLAPRRVHIFDLRAEFLQFLHAAERGEQGRAGKRRALVVEFEIFALVVAHFDPDSAVAILGFEILFPEVGRFQDMTVRIDQQVFYSHFVPPSRY
jgi:hypothetical protein